MFRRIGLIARREFITTVSRKGFLIGLLVMPVLMLLLVILVPRFLMSRSPAVQGQVVVVDPTGAVLAELRTRLDPAAIVARRADSIRRATQRITPGFGGPVPAGPPGRSAPVPVLQVVERGGGREADEARSLLAQRDAATPTLAVILVRPDAVVREAGQREFGSYEMFVSQRLDDATENVLHEGLRLALVSARLKAGGLDPAAVEESMRVERPATILIAGDGARQSRGGFNRALPFIMGILLFIGVMAGGQTLMTSTIEEKSSRVVEVLLAAVSPLELMWGKLLGQLGVGLLVMAVYVGLGLLALFQFALLGLIDPVLIVWLFVYFLLSYLVFGTLMLTIGAAVNQVADAQSLMGPVMLLLIAPYVMSPMIGQAPNSGLSVVLSFLPPVNSFAMLARLASGQPPPVWQALLSVAVSLVAAGIVVWFAAKVFRVGLLMHGKPPNFATLVRWARMA
jgi:ABC-type Na+ efflux pump permease subunit